MILKMTAYMYLLHEIPHAPGESGPWTKIGMPQNPPEWRLGANLKRGNSRELKLAAVYSFESVQQAREAEKRVHIHFQQFKHQREWFQIGWEQVAEWCSQTGFKRRD